MLSKNEIKHIQSLHHKKQRDEEQLFIAEGPKIAHELLQSSYTITKIYATAAWAQEHNGVANVIEVSDTELQRMSALNTSNQVILVARQKQHQQPAPMSNVLSLVVDDIQDPGNLGTIIRIADWFAIPQIICSQHTAHYYNPKVIQSTMGSFTRVNICYTNLADFLQQNQLPVYGAVLNGDSIYKSQLQKNGYLLIGNEGKGISEEISKFITHPISIPKLGSAESLNAAVATGILISHFK